MPSARITENTVTHFSRKFLKRMSDKYGGETTVNELRVMNKCYFDHAHGRVSGVNALSRELGIPKSTVSRAVTSLIDRKWLAVSVCEEDRRKRRVTLGRVALARRRSDWQDCIQWIIEASE